MSSRGHTLGHLEVSRREGIMPAYILNWIHPDPQTTTTSSSCTDRRTNKTPEIVIMNEEDVVSSFIYTELQRFARRQSNSESGDTFSIQHQIHPFIIPSVASTHGFDMYSRDESERDRLKWAVSRMYFDEQEQEGYVTASDETEQPIITEFGSIHYIDDVAVFTPERGGNRTEMKWDPGMLMVFNDEAMAYVEGIVNSGELNTAEGRGAADLTTMYEHWVEKFLFYVGES